MAAQDQALFIEVFPVITDALTELCAYRMVWHDAGDRARLGEVLAFRLQQAFGGHWVWAGGRLLTDAPPNPVKLLMAVDAIIEEHSKQYSKLASIEEDYDWKPAPDILARFVLHGHLEQLRGRLREALAKTIYRLKNARVEREPLMYAWVVNGEPALSFSVASRLLYALDVYQYAQKIDKPSELIGLHVADKYSSMQGEIVKVIGTVGEHRSRLVTLLQTGSVAEMLERAPDDDVVVRVLVGQHEQDFAGSALDIVVMLDDSERFDVDMKQASQGLRLKPTLHAQLVKIVTDIAKSEGLIANAYNTQTAPDPFIQLEPRADIVFGSNRIVAFDPVLTPQEIGTHGLYWWLERFQSEPLRIGVINTMDDTVNDFMTAMQRAMEQMFRCKVEVTRERKVRVLSQANLESAVRVLQKEACDVVFAFFEGVIGDEDTQGADDYFIKSQTIGRGMPCLVLHGSTIHNPDILPNLMLGALARAGNLPYLFDDPLDYCDYVVGLDLIRSRRKDEDYLTGVTRVYRQDGALLGFVIESAPVAEGEGIPEAVLARILPFDLLAQQRVVIHANEALTRDELRALGYWEDALDAIFYPVEIMRRGTPRLYAFAAKKIMRPPRGSGFRFNDREALIVTSETRDDSTPQPLYIRCEPPLTIAQALHSVMMFTQLHYGAFNIPQLPITIHHADYIRASILRGVLPSSGQGETPFWL